MPFDVDVKTRMFVRCNRHCCLCLKQCGINIEAAHIIDEAAGGSNDEDNGIPLCFDCHQEVGSYNDKHPRGNKFRLEELRARRDWTYAIVGEGKLDTLRPASQLPLQQYRDQLAAFLTESQHLRRRLDEHPLPIAEHNPWIDRVGKYLRDNFGKAHEVRFSDFSGMTFYGDGSERSKMSRSLEGRSRRLHELMSEMGVGAGIYDSGTRRRTACCS